MYIYAYMCIIYVCTHTHVHIQMYIYTNIRRCVFIGFEICMAAAKCCVVSAELHHLCYCFYIDYNVSDSDSPVTICWLCVCCHCLVCYIISMIIVDACEPLRCSCLGFHKYNIISNCLLVCVREPLQCRRSRPES